jgi:hypothetical protein
MRSMRFLWLVMIATGGCGGGANPLQPIDPVEPGSLARADVDPVVATELVSFDPLPCHDALVATQATKTKTKTKREAPAQKRKPPAAPVAKKKAVATREPGKGTHAHEDDPLIALCFEKRDYAQVLKRGWDLAYPNPRQFAAQRALGYARLATGDREGAAQIYRSLADWGLLPGDRLAPVREDLRASGLVGAEDMLALLEPPRLDRGAVQAFWRALAPPLKTALRGRLRGDLAPPDGDLDGPWLDLAFTRREIDIERAVDLAPLAMMPYLREIDIGAVPGLRFDQLAQLRGLEDIDLEACGLTDIGFAASLPRLKKLGLLENPGVTDLSPLAGARALEFLQLDMGVAIDDISFLRDKPALEWLCLALGKNVTDLAPLALPALEHLTLASNRMTSFEFLAGSPRLDWLACVRCSRLRSLEGLEGARALRWLELGGAPELTDYSALRGLAALENLRLDNHPGFTDLGVLGAKPLLKELVAHRVGVDDLSPAAKYPKLERLALMWPTRSPVRGVEPLLRRRDLELELDPKDFAPDVADSLRRHLRS